MRRGIMSDAALAERLAARTLEYVDIPSESRAEAELVEHVAGVLAAGGLAVDDAGDTCLHVVVGGHGPRVLLAGHLDTVPAQGNLPGSRDGEWVHGLGATDMLGACAVMTELALALRGSGDLGVQLELLFFGREELPADESALAPLFGRRPGLREVELAVVMEPTAGELHAGCLGNINASWTFHGRAGHSARPWAADNAIHRAAAGIAAFVARAEPAAVEFEGLTFTEVASVTQITGGVARNVVPDTVVAHVNHRYPPGLSPQAAEEHLRAWCRWDGSTLAIEQHAPSAPVVTSTPLARRLIAAGGLAVAPKQAWTPAAEFAVEGVDAVNYGPGEPRFAHRRDERVAVAALVESYAVLAAFCTR